MDQTYMKEKPVVPLLLSMGIPVIISMIAGALYNIVDSIFVAMISEDAMTAVSLVYPIQNLAHAAGVGFGVGINAMVARRLGEGKTRMANQTASQGVFLSALHGMILTILGMAVIPYFLRMFTSDEVTISYGLTYFCNVFLFSTIDTMGMAYEKVYQSVGKMKISMAAVLIGCGVNIVLDPIFIFGLGPMPELGIRGAAWATGIGQTASLLFYLILNHVKPLNVEISLREMRPSKEICGGMYSVGIAATLNMALTSLLLTALNAILAPFSQVYILVGNAACQRQVCCFCGADKFAVWNTCENFTAEGSHSHLVAAISDGNDRGTSFSGSRQEKCRIRDHVVELFTAHAVIMSVFSFAWALQADQMGRFCITDKGADKVIRILFRQTDQGCLRSAEAESRFQMRIRRPVGYD